MTSLFRQFVESGEADPATLRAITRVLKSSLLGHTSRVKALRAELALAEAAEREAYDRADALKNQQDMLHDQSLEPITAALNASTVPDLDVGAREIVSSPSRTGIAASASYPKVFLGGDVTVDSTVETQDVTDV